MTKRTILKFLARRFGFCLHPVEAIEIMHWSQRNADGSYQNELICGHICNICLGYVDIPKCDGTVYHHGIPRA
jgi:hypothetical protein